MGEILWRILIPFGIGGLIYQKMAHQKEHTKRSWWVIIPVMYGISGIFLGLDNVTFCLRFLLGFLLWEAAEEDQSTHEVADGRSFEVVLIALATWPLVSWKERVLGLCLLSLPQIILTMFQKGKGMGGADIKLSGALGFLLGAGPGSLGLSLGLFLFLLIYRGKKEKDESGKPLIPMLSLGMAIASYFVF